MIKSNPNMIPKWQFSTVKQLVAVRALCKRYNVEFKGENYVKQFDLPDDYVAGWVGPIYIGCDSEGRISS